MRENNDAVNLTELWEKLDLACRKLWAEDRASAVPLQALANEVKIGFQHSEQIVASLRKNLEDHREMTKREYEMQYENKLSVLEKQVALAKAHGVSLEQELAKARLHIEELLGQVEAKEEENVQFREKYLKIETQKDSSRAKKMDEFISELEAKEREREAAWTLRHQTLEADFKQRQEELERKHKKFLEEIRQQAEETQKLYLQKEGKLTEIQKQLQTEFQAREIRLREQEGNLHKQSDALTGRSRILEQEHAQKRAEIEALKKNLQLEIGELTRHYRPKAENGGNNNNNRGEK